MDNLTKIGYTKKTYGVQGELKVFVEDTYLDDFMEAKVVFLEINGQFIPHFVENITEGANLLIKFEDIQTKEQALALTARTLLLREEDIQLASEEEDDSDLAMFQRLTGFTLQDQKIGQIGIIEEVIEMPQQFMAILQYREKEIMIPLHQQLITGIDPEKQILEMDLPEGLLDVF